MASARRRMELRHPELAGQHGRGKLVVLASEVGERWSEECRQFLCQLVKAKTCSLAQTSMAPSTGLSACMQLCKRVSTVLLGATQGRMAPHLPQKTWSGKPVLQFFQCEVLCLRPRGMDWS